MYFKSIILSLSILSLTAGASSAPENETVRLIIKYKNPAVKLATLKSQLTKTTQVPVKTITPMANGANIVVFDVASTPTQTINASILDKLHQDPEILYAVKDRIGHFKPVPEPKVTPELKDILSHDSQWDEFLPPAGILLESKPGSKDGAWAYTTGKATRPVVVAVLDTGVALNDSLVDNLVKDKAGKVFGWNFAGNNSNLTDETKSYHGTHVAGTIAGYGNIINGIGVDLKILPVKIPAQNGMFYESAVINGIYWSVGGKVPQVPTNLYPAKVLNMSFGVDFDTSHEVDYCDEALQDAVSYARDKGAILAVAAGNDNVWEHYNAPAVCNGTIKVASTGPEGLRSYFSNYGPGITFAAPGGDKSYGESGGILSTVNPKGGYNSSGFAFFQGTSMASPHVAGVAGLIFALNKNLTAEQVEQILYTTTHDFGRSNNENKSCTGKKPCGHGIIDAKNALKTVVEGYDIFFSAPKIAALNVQSCGNTLLQPVGEKITLGKTIWVLKNTDCIAESNYQHPFIDQTENGDIYAHYGSVSYQLDLTQYKACQVIGYDGVGCYS